jgi:hypothetical protein
MQYSDQYNLTIKRQLASDMLLQLGYVGSQGHRLLASYELNPGNPNTCNDLAALGQGCSAFGEDLPYSFTLQPGQTLHLPYVGGGPNGQNIPCSITKPSSACVFTATAPTPITLVGIRPYSSPLCNPIGGVGCPVNGTPVFSGIFTENTVGWSNYNSFQAMLQKNFSKGLTFQAAYTFGRSFDNSSSFESNLNPLNFAATYGPSAYDARQRFVVNYVWDLPIPKFDGLKGKFLNGWELSGIATFQSGFPIRITSLGDVEELDSTYLFEQSGEPNFAAGYTGLVKTNIRQTGGFVFNPNQFTNATVAPGTIGNAPRTICCGPGINNWDMSFMKETMLSERFRMEFRGDVFNIWNHAQFYSVDGDVSNQGSTFGQVQHIRDPRLVQFALKLFF